MPAVSRYAEGGRAGKRNDGGALAGSRWERRLPVGEHSVLLRDDDTAVALGADPPVFTGDGTRVDSLFFFFFVVYVCVCVCFCFK